MFYQILQRFLWFTSFKFSNFLFQFDKEKAGGLLCNGEESWAVMVWSFTAVPGAHYTGKPQQTNAVNLPGMPAIEKSSCLCCAQSTGTFHQTVASEPKWRVKWWMRTMFRRWWGILWAFHTSICCEGVNLRRKLPVKLKNCESCYSFSTRDCGEFVAGERQFKRC